ncbi:type II secretion system protein [Pseudoduganella sp. LjRoot289]|uniref:type II secretion system protein n=1 Tax=Pseudoduganella sp. LjRoot289 TaxID=3342314 RepID=UPI003ECCAB7B
MASPTRSGRPGPRRSGGSSAGFTYLSLIILIAIIGLVSATTLKVGVLMHRSAAERELLNIGAQFSDALQSYAQATPPGQPTQPPSLKELLHDKRFPSMRRHLRKIFVDPMTGKAEWGIQYASGTTGVLAVYSLSDAKPIKVANFPARFQGFAGKRRLSEWRFVRTGDAIAPTPQPGKPGQPPLPGQPQQAGQPLQPGQLPPSGAPDPAVPGMQPVPAQPAPPPEPPAEPEPEPAAAPEPPPADDAKPEPDPPPEPQK